MEIIVKSGQTPYNVMRQCGYHPDKTDERTGEISFIKSIGASGFPRFHAFIDGGDVSRETLVIRLHLDQKRPVYRGTSAHSGEYDGPVVEKEAERIKTILGL